MIYKKQTIRILGLFTLLTLGLWSHAQTSVGLRLGSSVMGFTGADKYASDIGGSFTAASFIKQQFKGPWSLQAEVNYQRSGFLYERTIFPRIQNLRLHYVRTPLLLGYRLELGELSPTLYSGPSLGLLHSVQDSRTYPSEGYLDDAISNQQTAKVDMAWVGGVSVEYDLNNFFLTADLRYLQGLNSVDQGAATREAYSLYQSGSIFSAGVGFDLQ